LRAEKSRRLRVGALRHPKRAAAPARGPGQCGKAEQRKSRSIISHIYTKDSCIVEAPAIISSLEPRQRRSQRGFGLHVFRRKFVLMDVYCISRITFCFVLLCLSLLSGLITLQRPNGILFPSISTSLPLGRLYLEFFFAFLIESSALLEWRGKLRFLMSVDSLFFCI
jgi:hypothetical protein